jgi:hypothetical protein
MSQIHGETSDGDHRAIACDDDGNLLSAIATSSEAYAALANIVAALGTGASGSLHSDLTTLATALGASGTLAGLCGGIYHATTPTKVDGSAGRIEQDARGATYVQACVAYQKYILPPVTGTGSMTLNSTPASLTLGPCDGVAVNYSSFPIQIAGDLADNDFILNDEGFDAEAGVSWTYGANWSHVGSSAVAATASASVSQANRLTIGQRYLIVYSIGTYTSGTVTAYCGTTVGAARTVAATWSEIIRCAGNTTFSLTGVSFVGAIGDCWAFPLTKAIDSCSSQPMRLKRIGGFCSGTTVVDPTQTAGHGLWAEWYRKPAA